MNKLVLPALLATAAAMAACVATVEPLPLPPPRTDAVITARWQFNHLADGSSRACPPSFQTTAIYAQPWDPVTGRLLSQPVIDKFDCVDMRGTTDPLDGIFLVWVQIESDDGQNVYARSAQSYIDTLDGDVSIDFPILDDAGFFYLSWELRDKANGRPLSCRQASAGDGPVKVEAIATITGSSFMMTDRFPCEHGFGTTKPLLAGTYTVSVDAAISSGAIGTAPALIDKEITAPSGLTDLGHIMIPID
jgi:hypothetical protein